MTHSHAYALALMKTVASLYVKSRICYSFMREYLSLPHSNTVKSYFGTIDSPSELHECENTIIFDFSKLTNKQKYCKTLLMKDILNQQFLTKEIMLYIIFATNH